MSGQCRDATENWRNQERCPDCGRFCGVVYRYRGPSYTEVTSCVNCGTNLPKCAHEDGTVSGCHKDATHKGSHRPNRMDRYWCEDHAPESADPLPYFERSLRADTDRREE